MRLSKEIKESLTKEQYRFYKENGYLPTIQTNMHNSTEQLYTGPDKLTVLCVRFGNGYGIEYVEKLRNMVSRNTRLPYEFVCLTDDQHPIDGVRSIVQPNAGYAKQWWHKIHMFDSALPVSGRILYFDLDVIICSSIDKLVIDAGDKFFGIRDFNRKFHKDWKQLNSSVMSWRHGSESSIHREYIKNPAAALRMHGDQDWIWKQARDRITFWSESWIQSYKWEIRDRSELTMQHGHRNFKTVKQDIQIDPNCAVAVFHGEPNPCDVKDKFVIDHWR